MDIEPMIHRSNRLIIILIRIRFANIYYDLSFQNQLRRNESQLANTNLNLERLRKIHQELMDSLQMVLDFAHPPLFFTFTALFILSLTKMFFAQEATSRCMYRQAISMGCLALWIMIVVFNFCMNSQKFKDQVKR